MPRKISKKLKGNLLEGELNDLRLYLLNNKNKLQFEVRLAGDAFIYYRKGKVLQLKNLVAGSKKYGAVPDGNIAKENPKKYFDEMEELVDKWLEEKKQRKEFDTQQKVAMNNLESTSNYIIIDMEYSFSFAKTTTLCSINSVSKRTAAFDLIGIEKNTGKLCIFEVKTGDGSLSGSSGVEGHIKDFNEYFNGPDKELFMQYIKNDIEYIIKDKSDLGFMESVKLADNFVNLEPELIFVFESKVNGDIENMRKAVGDDYKLIEVGNGNYKL